MLSIVSGLAQLSLCVCVVRLGATVYNLFISWGGGVVYRFCSEQFLQCAPQNSCNIGEAHFLAEFGGKSIQLHHISIHQ